MPLESVCFPCCYVPINLESRTLEQHRLYYTLLGVNEPECTVGVLKRMLSSLKEILASTGGNHIVCITSLIKRGWIHLLIIV